MSIGVTVGKKIKILTHCVECVCTFAAVDIMIWTLAESTLTAAPGRCLAGRSDSWRATEARRAENRSRPEGPPRPEGPRE